MKLHGGIIPLPRPKHISDVVEFIDAGRTQANGHKIDYGAASAR
jgi:hypothetical protein